MGGSAGRRHDGAEEIVLALVRDHAGELLRFARRFSLCADDAQDAYQRALEILVKQLRTTTIASPLSYLRTIVRHEAYQVRVDRERLLSREEADVEAHRTDAADDPAERAERFERLAQTAEALARLKPQEVTALTLRAEGLSYKEICARLGWTYTRCNRAVSEGRRALLERLRAIESGAECDRWLPLLSAFADGEATARQVTELRPHLRTCGACRATLRGFHEAPRQLSAIVPPHLLLPALTAAAGGGGAGGRHVEAIVHGVVDRITSSALRFQSAFDVLPGAKVAAVAASTVAVAGGGAAIEHAATRRAAPERPVSHAERSGPSHASGNAPAAAIRPISAALSPSGGSSAGSSTRAGASGLGTGPEWPGSPPAAAAALLGGEFALEYRGGTEQAGATGPTAGLGASGGPGLPGSSGGGTGTGRSPSANRPRAHTAAPSAGDRSGSTGHTGAAAAGTPPTAPARSTGAPASPPGPAPEFTGDSEF
jgi:RNA polymerase sigma factor (sigma-70 family)